MRLGALLFTIYNYVIYTLSISFGPLFLVWVAVLGLSCYALALGLTTVDLSAIKARFQRPARSTAWFLIVVATLFCAVWLKDIVPALLAGEAPAGVRALELPTNPVHVMDLAVLLPGVIATGVMLPGRAAPGYAFAPASLVFLALTGMPIVHPLVAQALGETPARGVVIPIATVTTISLAMLVRHLSMATPHPTRDALSR